MNDLLSKPAWDMTDEELIVAKKLSAREQYANYCDENRSTLTIVPTYTDWLETALWSSQKNQEVYSAEQRRLLDDFWALVYPGQTDWEYPGMVYRHVNARIDELAQHARQDAEQKGAEG